MQELTLDVNLIIKGLRERVAQDAETIATLTAMNTMLANKLQEENTDNKGNNNILK